MRKYDDVISQLISAGSCWQHVVTLTTHWHTGHTDPGGDQDPDWHSALGSCQPQVTHYYCFVHIKLSCQHEQVWPNTVLMKQSVVVIQIQRYVHKCFSKTLTLTSTDVQSTCPILNAVKSKFCNFHLCSNTNLEFLFYPCPSWRKLCPKLKRRLHKSHVYIQPFKTAPVNLYPFTLDRGQGPSS